MARRRRRTLGGGGGGVGVRLKKKAEGRLEVQGKAGVVAKWRRKGWKTGKHHK